MRKAVRLLRVRLAVLAMGLGLPAAVEAQFNYTTNQGTITITGYTGSGSAVTIPSTINNLPVTSIGNDAFFGCASLTNVTIGNSLTNMGDLPFPDCRGLIAITVSTNNPAYYSVDGVLFNKSQTTLVAYPGGLSGSYTIPSCVTSIGDGAFYDCTSLMSVTIGNGVTNIGDGAFFDCTSLTSVTIPDSVTNIGELAFGWCSGLTSVYFQGNAPSFGLNVFLDSVGIAGRGGLDPATIYYLPGTTGWGLTLGGLPAALWNAQVQTIGGSFGVRTNQFGFNITGTSGLVVVIEGTTSLSNPTWLPLQTNTVKGGSLYFTDPNWTNYPSRFYRLTWP